MKILETQPKLVEQVYNAILQEIALGHFRDDERIIQEQIAQELGVSRQPVQQALVLLKNQGVLRGAPGRGLQVAPMDPEFVRQMYDIRAVMEGLAFRKAAENFKPSAKAQGEQLLANGRAAVASDSVRDLINADMAFHSFIYELSNNALIGPAMETQWINTQRVMGSVLLSADKPRDIWDEHEKMFQLVASGKAEEVEALARQHIKQAAAFMIEQLAAREVDSE